MYQQLLNNACKAQPVADDRTNFVYVGRLSVEKGIDVIFRAYQIQRFNLTIIGDGPLRPEVEAFAKTNPGIEYLGFQNKATILKVLSECTALLFCSKCYEGMPMTILESFSSGLPVIASALGCIPDVVTDQYNGLLFKNADETDLADKIQQWLYMSPGTKENFYNNSRETYRKKFSADANFTQLMNIYNKVIRKPAL